MDLAHPGNHLPLLRFKKGDEGVEELSPWKTLSEIWQEPPPAYRIHIFVTFTNRESDLCVIEYPDFLPFLFHRLPDDLMR